MNYWRSGEAKVGDDHGGNNLLKMKPKICKTIKKNKKKKEKKSLAILIKQLKRKVVGIA